MVNQQLAKHEVPPGLYVSSHYDFTQDNIISDQTLELAT